MIPNGINFNTVFAAAQKTLASTFGMELVELRQRLKGDVAEERAEEVRQARQTQAHAQATQTQRPRHTQADDEEDEEEVEGEKNKGKKTGRKGGFHVTLARNP